jgi:hypothetical protein
MHDAFPHGIDVDLSGAAVEQGALDRPDGVFARYLDMSEILEVEPTDRSMDRDGPSIFTSAVQAWHRAGSALASEFKASSTACVFGTQDAEALRELNNE